MGLSASQARFLTLTAKKSDLELEAQHICNARTRLADQIDAANLQYADKTKNTIFQFKSSGKNELTNFSYEELKSNDTFKKYCLTDSTGRKMVVASPDDVQEFDENSCVGKNYIVDDMLSDGKYFENMIREGKYFISEIEYVDLKNDNDEDVQEIRYSRKSTSSIDAICEVYDDSDDNAAKIEHDLAMSKLQKKDKLLECELKRIETSHKAIETEMESIEKVIKQNIENSFKTFSS